MSGADSIRAPSLFVPFVVAKDSSFCGPWHPRVSLFALCDLCEALKEKIEKVLSEAGPHDIE